MQDPSVNSGRRAYTRPPALPFKLVTLDNPGTLPHQAREASKNIFASHGTLHAILLRHEATIQNRWLKKKKKQRLKILLSAWPDMPTMHRPDFDAHRKRLNGYQDRFIWPYINQDDLLSNHALLLMLKSRGRHPPSAFAAADSEAMHLGASTLQIPPVSLGGHTMILNGADNPEDYGKLLCWEDHPDSFDWVSTQKQFEPLDGFHVLQAQERVLAFLVDCCRQILHDIPEEKLTSDAFPIQSEPCVKTEAEIGGLLSLEVMTAEAPYRLPAKLDLGRIESMLRAKASAAEDHIWAMREDPTYFSHHVLEAKDHWLVAVKILYSDTHLLSPTEEHLFWGTVIRSTVMGAYGDLEIFTELHRQAQKFKLLEAKYAATVSPATDLPDELLTALLKFRYFLNRAACRQRTKLQDESIASPPLRKFIGRKRSVGPKSDFNISQTAKYLIWLLSQLWIETESPLRMHMVIDELEKLRNAEPEAREWITSPVGRVIDDLSIIEECLKQLELYQPWVRNFESIAVDKRGTLEKDCDREWDETFGPSYQTYYSVPNESYYPAAKLGNPSNKRFFYPSDKRRTKENVEAMQLAERNLDDFWTTIDRLFCTKDGEIGGRVLHQPLSLQRLLQRTPDWVDEPKVAIKGQSRQKVLNQHAHAIYKPLSTLYFGQNCASNVGTSEKATIPVRAKQKTRGLAQETGTESTTDIIAKAIPEPMVISVDARALKVFRTLFFNAAQTSSPGEVAWNDFLHAMVSMDFVAEKLYGSVWQFQIADGAGRSSIHFHEPHPTGKIPFFMARSYGRRLNRAFGWAGEMFVLKDKANKANGKVVAMDKAA